MIAEKGMIAQSYTLIRCLLEPLFPLVAISKDPQFINLLIDSDEIKRKKNIERNIKYLERNKIQGNIEGDLCANQLKNTS